MPGVVELAEQKKVFLGGDDFKSGQTKIKSVMVDFLVSAGLKVGCVCVTERGREGGGKDKEGGRDRERSVCIENQRRRK